MSIDSKQLQKIRATSYPFLVIYAFDENNDWGYSIFITHPRGFGIIRLSVFNEDPSICMIYDFNITENNRHQKLGTRLIELAERIAQFYLGAEKIQLYAVDASWVGEWYSRMGYVKLDGVSDEPGQTIMEKKLPIKTCKQ